MLPSISSYNSLQLCDYLVVISLLQGDQNSPGIIPLAIKDVFSIIQDVSAVSKSKLTASLKIPSSYPS